MKSSIYRVDATWIGRAFARDRDLQLPERPRLIPEILVAPIGEDGLIFVGGENDQVVRGKSVGVLRTILPELDGRRTLGELAQDVGAVRPEHLVSMVSLLHSRGLLEEGVPGQSNANSHVASFLGRFVDVTRANPNRNAALARLAAARVHVFGAAKLVETVSQALLNSGVGQVLTGQSVADATLEVGLFYEGSPTAPPRRAPQRLMLRLGTTECHVGPLLTSGITSCESCLERLHAKPIGRPDVELAQYFVGVLATQVVGIVSKISSPALRAEFRVYKLNHDGEFVGETRFAPPMPGCAGCGLPGAPALNADDPNILPWLYHWSTALPTHDLVTPKTHQQHYLVANVELAHEEKRPLYLGSTVDLPPPLPLGVPPHWLGGPFGEVGAPLDVARLATLLARAIGEHEVAGSRRRVAPTGGNLGSVDAWIVASRVDGLQAGVYHYDAPRHRLEHVRSEPDIGLIRAALSDCKTTPDALIVGTGALAKCAQKYGPLSYRLIHLDSGVALTYLHTLAGALGVDVAEYGACSEWALADLLGLVPSWEMPLPTFALGLGNGLARPCTARVSPPTTRLGPRAYSEQVLNYLLDELARTSPSPSETAPSAAKIPRRIPELRSERPTLDDVILSRRAVREFTSAPVKRVVAEDLLVLAAQVLQDRLATGAAACFSRPVLAVARGDTDLPAGFYELDHIRGGLRRRADFDGAAMERCTNQQSLGESPAAIWILGDLASASEAHGVRGYRTMVQHAGSAVAAAWLAAASYGLGGTAAGCAIVGGLREAANIDPYRECPLVGFHFGVPTSSSPVGA